jgi:HK97 gp10 family phage protein
MPARYESRGLRQFIDHLPQAADRIAERVGRLAETSAKRRAHVITGRMRDSTHLVKTGEGKRELRADAPYSGFEEFGTRYRPAHPWFFPGLEDARAAAPAIIRDELKA